MLELENIPTPINQIESVFFKKWGVSVYIKREDLIHPSVSGNKYRKLKYNLIAAKNKIIVSFGGAYSNHIYALAAATQLKNIPCIGYIRGEELNENSSKTLKFASEKGMQLKFITRSAYRNKEEIANQYRDSRYFIIPEGGSNYYALKGVSEMVDELNNQGNFSHICCAVGTGGTLAGILSNSNLKSKIEGFAALKNGGFLKQDIKSFLMHKTSTFNLHLDYHFGGYAKYNQDLVDFIKEFEKETTIPIEQIYTSKMIFGVYDLIKQGYFPKSSKILLIHTGGLQGKINF